MVLLTVIGVAVTLDNARLYRQRRKLKVQVTNSIPVDWDVNVLESGLVLPVPSDPRWTFTGYELMLGDVRVHLADARLRIGGLERGSNRAKLYAIAVVEAYQQRRALAAIEGDERMTDGRAR